MKPKVSAIRLSRENIDDLSLACINPPVPRRYVSCFKSKLARFAESIQDYTLMNIMEYLIKFKQWFLSIRFGHRSPVMLYEDLLIIGILRVNKNQLLHIQTALISQKLEELLHRTTGALKERFYNFLVFLTNSEINKAIITNTDFREIKLQTVAQMNPRYLEINFLAVQRQLWAKSIQRSFNRDRVKCQNQIKEIVRQRMAAIRMHCLNTTLYTYRDSQISKKMLKLNQSNLHNSNIFTEKIQINDDDQSEFFQDKQFYTQKKARKQKNSSFVMDFTKEKDILKCQSKAQIFPIKCQIFNQHINNLPHAVSNKINLLQNKQIGQIAQIILKDHMPAENNKDLDKLSLWHKIQTQIRKKKIQSDIKNITISNNLDKNSQFSRSAKNFHLFLQEQIKKVEFQQIKNINKPKVINTAHRLFNHQKLETKQQFRELARKYEGYILNGDQKYQRR